MRILQTGLLVVVTLIALGCGGTTSTQVVTGDDVEATGEDGARGPYAVERVVVVDNGVDVELTLPVGEDAMGQRPHQTPVIVVQGGAVAKERYRWLTEHLTTRGFSVINAQHAFDLAIFDVEASLRALDFVRNDDDLSGRFADVPAVAIGHSLGGVVASKLWNMSGGDVIQHLVLLASLPDPADTFAPRGDGRIVFSIWGTRNGNTTSQEFYDAAQVYTDAADLFVVTIEGMNHYQFVEDPTDDELANDGVATIDIEDAQRTTLELVDRLCDDAAGTRSFATPPETPWPEGVETFDG